MLYIRNQAKKGLIRPPSTHDAADFVQQARWRRWLQGVDIDARVDGADPAGDFFAAQLEQIFLALF